MPFRGKVSVNDDIRVMGGVHISGHFVRKHDKKEKNKTIKKEKKIDKMPMMLYMVNMGNETDGGLKTRRHTMETDKMKLNEFVRRNGCPECGNDMARWTDFTAHCTQHGWTQADVDAYADSIVRGEPTEWPTK